MYIYSVFWFQNMFITLVQDSIWRNLQEKGMNSKVITTWYVSNVSYKKIFRPPVLLLFIDTSCYFFSLMLNLKTLHGYNHKIWLNYFRRLLEFCYLTSVAWILLVFICIRIIWHNSRKEFFYKFFLRTCSNIMRLQSYYTWTFVLLLSSFFFFWKSYEGYKSKKCCFLIFDS